MDRSYNWARCKAIMHGLEGEDWKRRRHMWSVPTTVVDDSSTSTQNSFCKVGLVLIDSFDLIFK